VGRFSEQDWARAKRLCRLSAEEVRMARALGLNPRKLPKNNPSPSQRWKAPVGVWVRDLCEHRFGAPLAVPRAAARPRPLPEPRPPDPEPLPPAHETEDFDGDVSWLDAEPTARELEEEDGYRLRQRDAFRAAADYVARAFAGLPFVQKVALFGSVARATPPTSRATARARSPAASNRSAPRPWPCTPSATASRPRRNTGTS
jgi:hypothetical protein